jgi:hypothetical protein
VGIIFSTIHPSYNWKKIRFKTFENKYFWKKDEIIEKRHFYGKIILKFSFFLFAKKDESIANSKKMFVRNNMSRPMFQNFLFDGSYNTFLSRKLECWLS